MPPQSHTKIGYSVVRPYLTTIHGFIRRRYFLEKDLGLHYLENLDKEKTMSSLARPYYYAEIEKLYSKLTVAIVASPYDNSKKTFFVTWRSRFLNLIFR